MSSVSARSANAGVFPSTTTIRHDGHPAETIETSKVDSIAQPKSAGGSGAASPCWLTFRKHPLADVQAGNPNCAR